MNLKELRREYQNQPLRQKTLAHHPLNQFRKWFEEATKAKVLEPNAMVLATASKTGKPSSRTVLLKHFDERGFVFYTNYESRKSRELEENPYASVTFLWHELVRQVCIEGTVVKISTEESAAYFASRPRGAQLGAWASRQDAIIRSRNVLEKAMKKFKKLYHNEEIPLPPYWGGFRLIPKTFEFWQGRSNRLHDRFRYTLKKSAWNINRLSP